MVFVGANRDVGLGLAMVKVADLIVGMTVVCITVMTDMVRRAGTTTETMKIVYGFPLHYHPWKIYEQISTSAEVAVKLTCTIRRVMEVHENTYVTTVPTRTRTGWKKEQW